MIRRSKKGFTLVETLAALLIVAMMTGAIAIGTRTSLDVYRNNRFASESGLLADSLHSILGDILHYAVGITGATPPTFASSYGSGHLEAVDGRLVLVTGVPDDHRPLLPDGAYTDLTVEDFTMEYTGGLFQGSYRIVSGWDGALSKTITFTYRPVGS